MGIIFIIAIAILIIVVIVKIAEDSEKEEEQENERKRSTKCRICNNCSMGLIICENCIKRITPIKKELPKKKTYNYESLIAFRKQTIINLINSTNQNEKELNSIRLCAIAEILEEKYFIQKAKDDAFYIIESLSEATETNKEKIVKEIYQKFDIKPLTTKELENTPSFDNIWEDGKKYKCQDNHSVRSKSERDIDDFLFLNRIWHIYESEYQHPFSKELARPDFYLPDYNLYIEYFGIDTPEYLEKREHKIKMYKSDKSINFEYLTFEDDENIHEKLKHILRKYNIPIN